MGHRIVALIGSRGVLSALIEQLGAPAPTEIGFDLVVLPLGELRLDMLTGRLDVPPPPLEQVRKGFSYLNAGLERGILEAVGNGSVPVLYIETHYFGGTGTQGAALFRNGNLVWRETQETGRRTTHSRAQSPISRGLSELGVPSPSDGDQFDAVGLSRFRSMELLGIYEWDDD